LFSKKLQSRSVSREKLRRALSFEKGESKMLVKLTTKEELFSFYTAGPKVVAKKINMKIPLLSITVSKWLREQVLLFLQWKVNIDNFFYEGTKNAFL